MGDERQFYQYHGGGQRDDEADARLSQRHSAAVFAEHPCDAKQRQYTEGRLQLQHNSPAPRRLWQRRAAKRNAMRFASGGVRTPDVDNRSGVSHASTTDVQRATAHN